MKDKRDGKFTVQVAATIYKRLHSRDSAERLARTVISLWRDSFDHLRDRAHTLVLDFEGIEQLSKSAAEVLIQLRGEFSEDKDLEIVFSNLSVSVNKTLAAVERPHQQSPGGLEKRKRKQNGFSIKV